MAWTSEVTQYDAKTRLATVTATTDETDPPTAITITTTIPADDNMDAVAREIQAAFAARPTTDPKPTIATQIDAALNAVKET